MALTRWTYSNGKILFCCLLIFLCSTLLTYLVRFYTLRKAILDVPNERSSHQIPTPRGGGIAIVVTFIVSILGLGWMHYLESSFVLTLTIGGSIIAAVGFYDDVRNVSARIRILFHGLIAALALYWLGGFHVLQIGTHKIVLSWIGDVIAFLGILWCINFYNFMDGIDGLAGSEGVFIALGSGMALWLTGVPTLAMTMWLLAAAIAGFTWWNWAPAKIFLGDVGSGFLGFVFAMMALYTANKSLLPIPFWGILSAVFFCDATFTLLYRLYCGKPIYSAHRDHAYQSLVLYGATHKQVTLYIIAINCFTLLPAAFLSLYWPVETFWLSAMVFLGSLYIWAYVKSSQRLRTFFQNSSDLAHL